MLEWLDKIDRELLLMLNGLGSPLLDQPMIWLSDKHIWIPFYALLLFFLVKKTKAQFYIPLIGIILIITICDQFTSSFMKPFFERLRPCHEPSLTDYLYLIKGCGGQYGFASSHAANSFGLAYFFHLIFKNSYSRLLLLWAILVSYSRIYLAAHYPGDVLFGSLIGISAAYLIFIMIQRSRFNFTAY